MVVGEEGQVGVVEDNGGTEADVGEDGKDTGEPVQGGLANHKEHTTGDGAHSGEEHEEILAVVSVISVGSDGNEDEGLGDNGDGQDERTEGEWGNVETEERNGNGATSALPRDTVVLGGHGGVPLEGSGTEHALMADTGEEGLVRDVFRGGAWGSHVRQGGHEFAVIVEIDAALAPQKLVTI